MKFSGVLDFVCHPRGQLSQRCELLLVHHLILGTAQIPEGGFECSVLLLEIDGQLLNQIQPLNLDRVLAEDVECVPHVGQLVVASYVECHLEVAFGHPAHARRQDFDPFHDHPSHEQPQAHGQGHEPGEVQHREHHGGVLQRVCCLSAQRLCVGEGIHPYALRRLNQRFLQRADMRDFLELLFLAGVDVRVQCSSVLCDLLDRFGPRPGFAGPCECCLEEPSAFGEFDSSLRRARPVFGFEACSSARYQRCDALREVHCIEHSGECFALHAFFCFQRFAERACSDVCRHHDERQREA